MAKNVNHVLHIKSKQLVDGTPKLPEASILTEGEIAVNFAKGYETLSIKNSNGDVKTFSSDDYYTKKKLGTDFTSPTATVTSALANKQDTLVSGTNIRTINGESMLGSGNIQLDVNLDGYLTKSGASDTYLAKTDFSTYSGSVASSAVTLQTSASTNASDIATLTTRVANAENGISSNDTDITNLQNSATTNASNISTVSGDVKTLSEQMTSAITEFEKSELTLSTAVNNLKTSKADYVALMSLADDVNDLQASVGGSYISTSTFETYSGDVDTKIGKKQDTLVSGTSIKTINNNSLLGSGNITIDLTLYKIVTELPTSSIDENKIYLVLSSEGGTNDKYTEYIYANSTWEKLGTYKADVDLSPYITTSTANSTFVKAVTINGKTVTIAKGDGTTTTASTQDTTYSVATSGASGLMSANDKKKLDGIAEGAQVNTVTGVKGSSEATYRVGEVNITAANIGLGSAATDISNLKTSASTNATNISSLSSKVTSLEDSTKTNASDISKLQTSATTNTTNIAKKLDTTVFQTYSATTSGAISSITENVEAMELVFATAINEIKSNMASYTALMALAEEVRVLQEKINSGTTA